MKFTEEHEWIRIEGDTGTVGITDYAQEQLGDVVYVELPEVGRKVEKGKEMAVVELVKAASEVYAPVSGEVVAVNDELDRRAGDGQCRRRWATAGSSRSSSPTGASSTG